MTFGRASIAVFVAIVMGVGCGGNDDPKGTNGVNNVLAACQIKATWIRTDQNKCDLCEQAVVSPRCGCSELTAFSGACDDQAEAAKPACPESILDCVNQCARTDCNCVEACYANNAGCKAAAAARDGCQAEVCTQYCK
jgi:hypothetical protein